jgi:hypothetical protein
MRESSIHSHRCDFARPGFCISKQKRAEQTEIRITRQVVGTCNSFRRASIGLDARPTGKSLLDRFRDVSSPF